MLLFRPYNINLFFLFCSLLLLVSCENEEKLICIDYEFESCIVKTTENELWAQWAEIKNSPQHIDAIIAEINFYRDKNATYQLAIETHQKMLHALYIKHFILKNNLSSETIIKKFIDLNFNHWDREFWMWFIGLLITLVGVVIPIIIGKKNKEKKNKNILSGQQLQKNESKQEINISIGIENKVDGKNID